MKQPMMPESELPSETTGRVYTSGPFRGLSSNVILLGAVSFLTDVSSEMLYPLVPIFLTTVVGAPVAVVGLIEGIAESIASLLKTVSGRMSDRSGRRLPYITSGYTISAISKPLLAAAVSWPMVLIVRAADRLGKGIRTSPRDALLADSASIECRGRAFGLHKGMDTLGAAVGPLLALMLIHLTNHNLRLIFMLAFIPGIMGAALTLTLREHRRAVRTEHTSIRYSALPPAFRAYLIAWGVFAVANSSDVFLILRAQQMGLSTTLVILLYVLYNLIYALASPGLGHLSDRLGRKKVLVGGLTVFALVYIGFALAVHQWHLWVLFGVYGLYTAATGGVGKAMAVDLVPSGIRASALGLLGTVTGIAALLASSTAGVLWSVVGSWAAFGYGALGALLGGILISRIDTR